MIPTKFSAACCAFFLVPIISVAFIATPMHGQQASVAAVQPAQGVATTQSTEESTAPTGQPGVYIQDSTGWHLLAQNANFKGKVKHGFVSGLTYGAVSAPMVIDYAGAHATVQINATQPHICAYRILFASAPLLVRLQPKKQKRELDSGSLRAVPLVGASKEAKASASSIVPTTTLPSTACETLLQPQAALDPGEYAVMFGAQNLAIMDFGVADSVAAVK